MTDEMNEEEEEEEEAILLVPNLPSSRFQGFKLTVDRCGVVLLPSVSTISTATWRLILAVQLSSVRSRPRLLPRLAIHNMMPRSSSRRFPRRIEGEMLG